MGYSYEDMSRALRFSSSADTNKDDWLAVVAALQEVQAELGSGRSTALGKISLTDL